MNYSIKKYSNAKEFFKENEELLLKDETFYNLIIGLAERVIQNPEYGDAHIFLAIICDETIIGQALRTHYDKPLSITSMNSEAIERLVDYLKKEEVELASVVGPSDSSISFSNLWTKGHRLGMDQGVYELSQLSLPNRPELSIRLANESDSSICYKFTENYILEALAGEVDEKFAKSDAISTVDRVIKAKRLYLLVNENDEIVSMASWSRDSKNSGTIALVYTPKELRGNGYGSMVTGLVSKTILDSGKRYCSLFTDLTNPTSNSIYQKLGYEKIGEFRMYRFN